MNRADVLNLARRGQLYPSVILHGGAAALRQDWALTLARALLCERDSSLRPCGECRHCRRIVWPDGKNDSFHPDFLLLERDLRTSTSVLAARTLMQAAQQTPFEARGQVFVLASAETLTGEAANALLKVLEEPPVRAPRNFLLLAPSRLDLLPTLRSRSLSVYLGPAEQMDEAGIQAVAAGFSECIRRFHVSGSPVHLLAAAGELTGAGSFDELRAERPWVQAAAAVRRSVDLLGNPLRGPLLALAEALLAAGDLRLRGIPAERILEGLVARHLGLCVAQRPAGVALKGSLPLPAAVL